MSASRAAAIAYSAGSSSSIRRGLCDHAPENATAVMLGAGSSADAPSGVEKSAADGLREPELLRLTVPNPRQIGACRLPGGRARYDEGIPLSAPLPGGRSSLPGLAGVPPTAARAADLWRPARTGVPASDHCAQRGW